MGTLTAGRVENLSYGAYDSIEIWAHCILLGHKPIIDVNPRRSVNARGVEASRSVSSFPKSVAIERSINELLGYDKVLAHLMFGMEISNSFTSN